MPSAPWSTGHNADYFLRLMSGLADQMKFDINTPWKKLPIKARIITRDEQI